MITFLTFSNSGYMNISRITNQAKEFQIFDEIIQLTEKDIPDYRIRPTKR